MRYQDTLFYDDGGPIIPVTDGPFGEETNYVSEKEEGKEHHAMADEPVLPPQPERAA
jgi:hypothetical protein